MDQEFGEDLVVGLLVFYDFVPHVHDDHVLVILDEFLGNFEKLRKELKALVIYQVVE
jgi:hypothetical protein